MTGLAGTFTKKSEQVQSNARRVAVDKMSQSLTHKDGRKKDIWSGSNATLARVHHGVANPNPQPATSKNESFKVFFWGEIFANKKLKRKLKKDGVIIKRENDDAELVAGLLKNYGYSYLQKLNGSFAIAFYDLQRNELGLATDRLSTRPIYYRNTDQKVVFATKFGPVIEKTQGELNLDHKGIYEFFAFTHLLDNHTYYRSIKTVRPATVMTFSYENSNEYKYWDHSYMEEDQQEKDEPEYVKELSRAIKNAVNRRSSEPRGETGLFLSAGLDARLALAAAESPLSTFSIGDRKNKEVKIAEKLASIAGTSNIFLERDPNHYLNLIEEAVELGGGMHQFSDAHFLGIMDKISEHCSTILNTYGFDARLKGHFFPPRILKFGDRKFSLKNTIKPVSKQDLYQIETWRRVPSSLLYLHPEKLFNPEHKNQFNEKILDSLSKLIDRANTQNPYYAVEFPAIHSFRSLSTYLAVMSARAYLSQRTIVFDSELIELSLKIPVKYKANGYILKRTLKKLSPELAKIPNNNTGIRADAPWLVETFSTNLQAIGKKFFGFGKSPEGRPTETQGSWPHWPELIRRNNGMKSKFKSVISDPNALPPNLFDRTEVTKLLKKHLEGKQNNAELLISLVTFGTWYRKYGPH